MTHEVQVLCNCTEDPCRTELYVSDVRIAYGVIKLLEAALRQGKRDEQRKPKLLLVV